MHLKKYFKLSLLAISLISCETKTENLPYYNSPDFTPIFLENQSEVENKINHKIGAFSFADQNGKTISDQNIGGKIHIASFFFTSCGAICPTITSNLKKAIQPFSNSKDVTFLSFSVTPWIDNQVKLKEYVLKNNIKESNWHFLTGKKSEIYELARKSYFAEEELGFTKDSTDFLHTEHVLLIDKSKRIRGIYNGTLLLDTEQLEKDISILLKE